MNAPSPFQSLVAYFAPALGAETSAELIREIARERELDLELLEDAGVCAILRVLERRDGVVGAVARSALRRTTKRITLSQIQLGDLGPRPATTRSGTYAAATAETESVDREELEGVLGATMPLETARKVVHEYWESAGMPGTRCTPSRALALFDRMANGGGAIGIAATFAKARWHLRRTAQRTSA